MSLPLSQSEAEPRCRAAIRIDPQRYNAHKNLGLSLEGLGRYAEAAQAFVEAVRAEASDPRALKHLEEAERGRLGEELRGARSFVQQVLVALIQASQEEAAAKGVSVPRASECAEQASVEPVRIRLAHDVDHEDIADEDQCATLVDGTLERFGRLDILVNNAGWTTRVDHADHEAMTNEILFKTIEVNVYGTWWMSKKAVPHLKQTEGCIVNVTSIAGLRPLGSSLAYGMAKAALNSLTEDMAKFQAPVRVNAVAPGLVATPWTADWEDLHAGIAAVVPSGRSATSEDCAQAVLTCVTNTYMNGSILKVDGGTTLVL